MSDHGKGHSVLRDAVMVKVLSDRLRTLLAADDHRQESTPLGCRRLSRAWRRIASAKDYHIGKNGHFSGRVCGALNSRVP